MEFSGIPDDGEEIWAIGDEFIIDLEGGIS